MRIGIERDEFSVKLGSFSGSLKDAFFRIMRGAGSEMEAYLKASISTQGELVNGKRLSSAPYNPPYKVSGNLVKSTGVNYTQSENSAKIQAGTNTGKAPYGVYLEYGSARMKPRPYLLPAGIMYFNKICNALRKIKEEL